MWFIGVEVEQETSAPPPKKNPGSAPAFMAMLVTKIFFYSPLATKTVAAWSSETFWSLYCYCLCF